MSGDHLNSDSLAEGLEGLPPSAFGCPEAPPELREAILRRTRAAVRRRPRRRRLLATVAVAAAYSAGLGTAVLWSGAATGPVPFVTAEPASDVAPAATSLAPVRELTATDAASAPADERPASPRALLARVPDAAPAEQVRLLTRAGDRYLTDYGDVQRALDCYRQVLELTPRSQPAALGSGDTWLLTSLKLARLSPQTHNQEVSHEDKSS